VSDSCGEDIRMIRARYEQERANGLAALKAGCLEEAHRQFTAALTTARSLADSDLLDLATCSEASVAIALGDVQAPIPRLREVLMRSANASNCAIAAHSIARAYELRKEYRKSLFYARCARDRAAQADSPDRMAAAENQIGNALLAQSFFDEAATSYRRALASLALQREDWRLICEVNLGYCEVVLGRLKDGLRRLYSALRDARRAELPRLEMIALVDLCFAHLELERHVTAERHGRRGLELAEKIGEVDWIKNALYLLGQIAVLRGDVEEAHARFAELQQRFYPGHAFVPELLINVDVRQLVNLRA